jgi:hypothetical protein
MITHCQVCGDVSATNETLMPGTRLCTCGGVPALKRRIAELERERNEIASDLWCAEDQWGDDYLWKKWELSRHLTDAIKESVQKQFKSDRAKA